MEVTWTIVCIVLVFTIWGIVANRVRNRRIQKETEKLLPRIADHIRSDHHYDIFLSHGKTLVDARFIGISKTIKGNYASLPFPLQDWLIVEKPTGERAYIKPESVRYYEDHGASQ